MFGKRGRATSIPDWLVPRWENFVLTELRKQSRWSVTQPQFYYWRTASGQEIDIVLEDSTGSLVGIEIKASATLHGGDLRGLQTLADAAGKRWIRGVAYR